ncbi:MAG: ABC transporter ATP-binding protein, partial [Candidatus Heimdallarchaeota archaeon]
WLVLMLGTAIVQAGTFFVISITNEFLAHRVTTDMTADLFITLQQRPLSYHDRTRIGDVMARATGDTRIINIGLSPAFRIIGQIIVATLFSLGIFVIISIELATIFLLTAPLYGYLIVRYGKKIEPISKQVQDMFGKLSIQVSESLLGIRELKSYTAEPIIQTKFSSLSARHSAKVKEMSIAAAWYYPAFIMAFTLGVTVILGVIFITQGTLKISELVVFIGLITFLTWISRNLQWVAEYTARTNSAARRMREMLYDGEINPPREGQVDFDGKDATIEFRDVSFTYDSDQAPTILNNLSIRITHGETVCIVGGPGSGKSTFIKLLLRLYEPTKGRILLAGRSLTDYTDRSLRQQLSSIEQEIFLFSDTVRNNLAFGSPAATDEQIIAVAKQARAHDFIMHELENSYDTLVGERGVTLSGGQKQRIAIGRALLMNPRILIMDDASSALDAETEAEIQSAIRTVLHTRTAIISTHRIGLIAEADRVIMFDRGEIVAHGSHDYLIRTSHSYRQLFEQHYQLPPMESGS